MLTRIYIDNFRSFVNFEYRPNNKQLLLGASGSGKSSLLDALQYVKWFIDGDENPFTQSSHTRWQNKPLQVVEIEASLLGKKFEYRVEIRSGTPSVNLEVLKVSGTTVFELANGEISFFSDGNDKATAIPVAMARSALHLSQLSNSHVRTFVDWIDRLHCFRMDTYPDEMEESADNEERRPDYELGNLASWYSHLVQAYPDENVVFIEALREALDGFQTLRFSSEEDGVKKLRADFSGPAKKKVSYSLSELSEGQRSLVGLYMILHFVISKGDTVFIDEPDNFVSLREIQPWLQAAEEAVEDHHGQLILISHHPEILNQWALRHGLRFFRDHNGHVRTEIFKADPKGTLQPSELIARGWEDA